MDINSFYEGLDSHLHKLLKLFRSKRFEEIEEITSLMESLDKDASTFLYLNILGGKRAAFPQLFSTFVPHLHEMFTFL